jgi:hypothetical protein
MTALLISDHEAVGEKCAVSQLFQLYAARRMRTVTKGVDYD